MGLFKEFYLNESEVSKAAKLWGLKHLGFNHYKDPRTTIVWTWNKDLKKFEKAKEQNMKIYSGDEVDIPYKEYATPPFLKMVKDFDETMNIDVDKAISDRVSSLELQKVIKSAIKRHTKWRDQSGSSALHSAVVLSMSLLLDELRKSMKLSKTTNESLDEDEDLIIETLNKSQYIVKKESLIDWYVNRKDNPTKWIAHIGKEKLGYNVKFNLKFGSIHGKDDKYFFRSMKEAIKFIEEHGDLDESLVNESFGPSKPIKVTVDHWDGGKPVIAFHYEKTPNMKGNGISYTKVLKIYWKIVKKGTNDPKLPHLDGVNDTKELWAEVIELDSKFKPYGVVLNQSVNDLRGQLLPKMKVELSFRY